MRSPDQAAAAHLTPTLGWPIAPPSQIIRNHDEHLPVGNVNGTQTAQSALRLVSVQDGGASGRGVRGGADGGGPDLEGAGRGQRCVRGPDRSVPPGTAGALLPDARLSA